MKNRETIMRRLERIESKLSVLDFILNNQGTRENFKDIINEIKESLQDAKSFIQQEPLSPGEINNF